ncbi:MAG: S8 family serine peptidase [Saprospiraceae bacterium]|nr:S8 family serine peptidase [Saprospiraceae bacterium]
MMMTSLLYPAAFLLTLFGLGLWMLLPKAKSLTPVFRSMFMLGAVSWIACLVVIDAEASHKLLIGARDLLSIGIVSLILQQARSNRAVGLAIFIGTAFFVRISYWDILKNSFVPMPQDDSVPELLVELASVDDLPTVKQALEGLEVTIASAFAPDDPTITELDNYFLIDAASDDEETARRILEGHDRVRWVEENEVIHLKPIVSEEALASSPGTSDPLANQQWALKMMEAEGLHSFLASNQQSLSRVKVAVLDTGVDSKHEDLQDHYTSTKPAYDIDTRAHGTHVAGIIAATTGNQKGVSSLMVKGQSFITVTSIKVFNAFGGATQEGIIDGMIEAADGGAKVINMSLGGRSTDEKQKAYNEAISYCQAKGAIVVVSAGNSNNNSRLMSPANAKGVIAVAAVDSKGKRAAFSSMVQDLEFGLAAPGVDVLSTVPANKYRGMSGTSMAAPMVSAAVALCLSMDPSLTTAEVYQILHKTGKASNAPLKTGRIIQPLKALRELAVLEPAI